MMLESVPEFMFYRSLIALNLDPTPQHLINRTEEWKRIHGPEPRYFRLDFALVEQRLAIEIDGHAYHCTQDQREADARRQREITHQGWTVIRFTAREVFTHPRLCAAAVKMFAK